MENIELIKFNDITDNYQLLHKWCSQRHVYEWFEQRILSYEEIVNKYKKKLLEGKQDLYLINCDHKPIGLIQLYQYEDLIYDEIKEFKNIYEFDLFIGEIEYLHKGIGTMIVNLVDELLFHKYAADCIILRSFKRNINAIKCYQKNGYNIINEYDGEDTVGNEEKIVVLMKGRIYER